MPPSGYLSIEEIRIEMLDALRLTNDPGAGLTRQTLWLNVSLGTVKKLDNRRANIAFGAALSKGEIEEVPNVKTFRITQRGLRYTTSRQRASRADLREEIIKALTKSLQTKADVLRKVRKNNPDKIVSSVDFRHAYIQGVSAGHIHVTATEKVRLPRKK